MIRCENCGHKLNAGQKVCDVCGRPVPARNTEDAELEEQLAKSIAQIVENETSDAQVYLKEIQGTLDKSDSSRKQGREMCLACLREVWQVRREVQEKILIIRPSSL